MKSKKKGFTLIELLAVIVIIAIIALIAVPIVLNLVEKARKGSVIDSAYGLRKSAQLYYASSLLEDVSGVDITFNCDKVNGCVSEDNKVKLDIDGTIPSNGKIEVKSNGEITYNHIVINGYTCEMENKGEITCTKGGEEAPSVDKTAPTITLGEIITTENSITVPYTVDDTEAIVTCEYGTDTNYGSVGTVENGTCVINDFTAGTEYFYKITATDQSNNSSSKEGSTTPIILKETLENKTYTSGDAVTFGGYNWHVISDDGTNVTLLMDGGQLADNSNMAHCTDDTDSSTDCGVEPTGRYYIYSWDKSLIRTYLNGEFLTDLENKITNEIASTKICADPSRYNYAVTYGGYLMSEINEIDGASCETTIVNDKVRLISYSEYYNLSPHPLFNTTSVNYPNVNRITRLSADSDYASWLYCNSSACGDSSGFWWTMGTVTGHNIVSVQSARRVLGVGNMNGTSGNNSHGVRPVITIVKE